MKILIDESSEKKMLIYGVLGQTVRGALLSDWPLDHSLLRERWVS